MSKYLVVVGGPNAFKSEWVYAEIKAFLKSSKSPILINIDDTVRNIPQDNRVYVLLKNRLFITEATGQELQLPSPTTLDKIAQSFTAKRKEKRKVTVISIACIVLALVSLTAILMSVEANRARGVAEKAEKDAIEAFKSEQEQREVAVEAAQKEIEERERADSLSIVYLEERDKALESYAQKELSELKLLRKSPINSARTQKLLALQEYIRPIQERSVAHTVDSLISQIPSDDFLKLQETFPQDILDILIDRKGTHLTLIFENGIEIWDTERLVPLKSIRTDDFEDHANGDIVWWNYNPCSNRLHFEVEYFAFAIKKYNEDVQYGGWDFDMKKTYDFKDVVKPEKEIYSIRFDDLEKEFIGVSQHLHLSDPMRDFSMEEAFHYRDVNYAPVKKVDYVMPKPTNRSSEIPGLMSVELRYDLAQSSTDILPSSSPLVLGECESGGIYSASQIAFGMAMAGQKPVLRVPFFYNGDTLVQIHGVITDGRDYSDPGFIPAAFNPEQGLVLLNERLIQIDTNYQVQLVGNLDLDNYKSETVDFSIDGSVLISKMDNGDYSLLDLKTKQKRVFLSANTLDDHIQFSASAGYVFIKTDKKTLTVWETRAFSETGWAKPD